MRTYKFKIGDVVKTITGFEGRVIARFHPPRDKNLNSYVIQLTYARFPVPIYGGDDCVAFSVAEYFIDKI
jgi:hypothetical protein